MKRVLVLGGSGDLGAALLAELFRAGVSASFTYHRRRERAEGLSRDLGFASHAVDLRRPEAVAELFEALARDGALPEAVVHCAGIAPVLSLDEIDADGWDAVQAVHGRAALQCAQQMQRRGLRGALVLVGALDGLAPVAAPAHYAASQGALWGLTMSLAKSLGPQGILVNLAVAGVLDGGISVDLAPPLREAYRRYSALGRTGTCAEAARALRWLALENTYLNGAQFPVTGGLG
jgi:3-oxoacyl-[acyl-carrier protein] reductase